MQAGPFQMEQRGADLVHGIDPNHPDYEAFRAAMREQVEQTPEQVRARRQEIAKVAAPHHAFDVICATWMSFGLVRPDSLQSYHPEGSTATAEYVAHVLLERPGPQPIRRTTPEDRQRGVDVRRLGELVAEILSSLPPWFSFRQAGEQHQLDPYLEVRTRLYMHRLGIRSFTFEWQERETLRRLFDPFEAQLRERLGFTAVEGLALAESLGGLPLQRTAERGAEARAGARQMKDRVRGRRAKGAVEEAAEDFDRVAQLATLSTKDAERWIDHTAITWIGAYLGQTAAFTAGELAQDAGVDEAVAVAFLRNFSVDFGGRADLERWREDPRRAIGGEMEVMRRRPVLHDGGGRYLPAAVDSVFYGLRDVLTDALKDGDKVWSRFDRHRARDLETRALHALGPALKADWSYGGVKYEYLDELGQLVQGEADGVLRADNLVVLVESKAGSLTESARRAAPERLERSLRDLIVSAHEQLARAERALVDGAATKITDRDGKPLELDLAGRTRVLRIAVNLEDLSPVAPAVWQLQDAGLLPAEEVAPWTVGIHDLELICSLVERPAQLVHYVLRRLRTYRQRVWAMDEMDFWMRYLSHGLWWEDEQVQNRMVQLLSHTDALDAWAYGERGLRSRAKRPRQKLDSATRRLLDAMEATGANGRLEAQLMLLEMDGSASKRLASALRQLGNRTRRDGQIHDMTLVFGDDMAVTVQSVPPGQHDKIIDTLADYGLAKVEQHGLRRWTGLSTIAGSGGKLSAMVLFVDPVRLREV